MSANANTGRTREVRYCGSLYTVSPGVVHEGKQAWKVECNGTEIRSYVWTRSKAVKHIHEHAVESGAFPSRLDDGVSYGRLVSICCN